MSSTTTGDRAAPRRRNALAPTIAILAVVMLLFILFARIWTDLLWYRSVDATQVFTVRLISTMGLFAIFGILMGAAAWINMAIAYRLRPRGAQAANSSSTLGNYRQLMERRPQLVVAVPSVLLAILAGAGAVSNVDLFLAWLNATPFGTTDPYFGLDVAFFIFHLPWWRFVVGQLIWTLIVALLAAAAVHFVTGSLRTSPMPVTAVSRRRSSSAIRSRRMLRLICRW